MATGTSDTHLQAASDQIIQEIQELTIEAGNQETCTTNPNVNSAEHTIGSLNTLRLEVESELEALLETPLEQLPSDPALLQGLGTEQMEKTALHNARTLNFYKKKTEELKEKKRIYERMVKRASAVSQKLDKLQQQCQSEEDKRVILERRSNRTTMLFKFLRSELHFILENLYPEETSTPQRIKSLEDLLDCLVSKMMSEPSDPYVLIDETMDVSHLTLLQTAGLISRHPNDITRIKFIDPRT